MNLSLQEQVLLTPPFIFENFEFDAEKIYRVEGNIPSQLPVEDGAKFLFISKDQRSLTHGIHKYPAKFFPELPRWLIEKYSNPGELILDPFMGSATTNLEASLLGRDSIGVDIDPFSRLLSRVKTTRLPKQQLEKVWKLLRSRIENYVELDNSYAIPSFPYSENWFKPYIMKELAFIKGAIQKLRTNKAIKEFFLINFSGIIRRVSEADNNCTRTVIRWNRRKTIEQGKAIKLFLQHTEQQVMNMIEFSSLNPSGKVDIPDNCDARSMPAIKDGVIDCAITSPPYANAVDYPRTHQLEIYWLGIETGSLRDLKIHHVGTEVVAAKDYKNFQKVGVEEADQVLKSIFEIDPRRAFIASKYLIDMFENLREVWRVLKNNGRYIIVIGNNSMRGIEFETWKYLSKKAVEIGFEVECKFCSEIINHHINIPRKERINRDHILVLKK